ncbi:MAG: hypothetical protein WDW36_003880 [Sanguina aurantia]
MNPGGMHADTLNASDQEDEPEQDVLGEPEHDSDVTAAAASWPTISTSKALEAGLYVVATPIGNLEDITLRALRVLRSVDLVLAEDTRHTRKLLNHYGIAVDTLSFHAHNEKGRTQRIVERLQRGECMALVSDAGTPGISDPGVVLVAAAIAAGVRVTPLPGACAVVTALVASGLPTESFTFQGFLPPKSGARCKALQACKALTSTQLFYVPPHGLQAVLADMVAELGGERRCCVARELTKLHEEFLRCTLSEAAREFSTREPRGEIVMVVAGADAQREGSGAAISIDDPRVLQLLGALHAEGMPLSAAVREVVQALGVNRKAAYPLALSVWGTA